jgi:hypothetical protein
MNRRKGGLSTLTPGLLPVGRSTPMHVPILSELAAIPSECAGGFEAVAAIEGLGSAYPATK